MAPSFDNLPDDVDLDDIEVDFSGPFAPLLIVALAALATAVAARGTAY